MSSVTVSQSETARKSHLSNGNSKDVKRWKNLQFGQESLVSTSFSCPKGHRKLKIHTNQGLNFIISNCFPAKVIYGKSTSESLQIHQRKSHSLHVLQ